MRQRFGRLRARSMARRPGDDERFTLSPRARQVAGWVAAVVLIGGVALAVGILGGNADGTSVVPEPSGTDGAGTLDIAFGTAIDAATGEVADDARTNRFADGDTFAYSVRPHQPPPETVYVEVRNTAGGPDEVVQEPAPHGLAPDAQVIAFSVPATGLVTDFGPGTFRMLIYLDPGEEPIAEGTFEVVAPLTSPSP